MIREEAVTHSNSLVQRVVGATTDRRTFLAGTGAAGVALAVAACGSSTSSSQSSSGGGAASASPSASGDVAVAMVAASLEVLAVSTYQAGGAAATANKLGPVPPAVVTFVTTVGQHHQAALDKWNSVITAGGGQAVTSPPADLNQSVQAAFMQVTDVAGLAKLALMLEQTASDTYLKVGPTLQSAAGVTLAGALQVVDQMHIAVLNYVLGTYPVPDVFQKTDMAYSGTGAAAASPTPT